MPPHLEWLQLLGENMSSAKPTKICGNSMDKWSNRYGFSISPNCLNSQSRILNETCNCVTKGRCCRRPSPSSKSSAMASSKNYVKLQVVRSKLSEHVEERSNGCNITSIAKDDYLAMLKGYHICLQVHQCAGSWGQCKFAFLPVKNSVQARLHVGFRWDSMHAQSWSTFNQAMELHLCSR